MPQLWRCKQLPPTTGVLLLPSAVCRPTGTAQTLEYSVQFSVVLCGVWSAADEAIVVDIDRHLLTAPCACFPIYCVLHRTLVFHQNKTREGDSWWQQLIGVVFLLLLLLLVRVLLHLIGWVDYVLKLLRPVRFLSVLQQHKALLNP
jgi:hypothetical protein